MNEKDYMNITNGIDERFVREYQELGAKSNIRIHKRWKIALVLAACLVLIPVSVFAASRLTHREKLSIYYTEDGVKKMEESLKSRGFSIDNGQICLTVDVEMCDGNYSNGVFTLTALTEEARSHLESYSTKFVYADTGERVEGGGGSQGYLGEAQSDDEISVTFSYQINRENADNTHAKRLVFFEYVETGEFDGYGMTVVEDYTFFEGIYFDILLEPNVPVKTLCADDGTEITLSPNGVSRVGEEQKEPEDDIRDGISINSITVISKDGSRTNIISVKPDGRVTSDLERVYLSYGGDFGSGTFNIDFGTFLNVENISGVEINGVAYMEK